MLELGGAKVAARQDDAALAWWLTVLGGCE